MYVQGHVNVLEHARLKNVVAALVTAAACFIGVCALLLALTGCAVAAGAAAGGAAGYVAGHEAGEDEAREEMRNASDDDR